jgi:hypothetical protein
MDGGLVNLTRAIVLLAMTGIASPAFGQFCGQWDPNNPGCWQQQREEEARRAREAEEEKRRRDEAYAEESARSAAREEEWRRSEPERIEAARQQEENAAALRSLRESLLAMPALPQARNPLLGRWRVSGGRSLPAADAGIDQLMGLLMDPSGLAAMKCTLVFGEGSITEFQPGSWAVTDSAGTDSLGAVQYRTREGLVFALPAQGLQLLGFEIVDRNTIKESLMTPDCVLVRDGVASTATPVGTPAQGGGTTSTIEAAGAAADRPPPDVCRQILLDQLGRVRVEQARTAIGRRFPDTVDGKPPNIPDGLRIDARGSTCDDPRVNAVLYDFDAGGTLQWITFVWQRAPGPAPAPIFSERVARLSKAYPLPPPQSSGRLQADTPLGRLILQDMPERNLLLEAYKAR